MNWIRDIFATLAEARRVVQKRKADAKDKKERAAIAKAFNDRYTYLNEWVKDMDRVPGVGVYGFTPRGGFAWMCHECNKIHHPAKCDVFTGLQYPACCSSGFGHRLDHDIRKG